MIELSNRTANIIQSFFPAAQQTEVIERLKTDCADNLPFCENYDAVGMERIRFAVLKLSKGQMDELLNAIALAQTDWRDLLMAADFGHDLEAHKRWANDVAK